MYGASIRLDLHELLNIHITITIITFFSSSFVQHSIIEDVIDKQLNEIVMGCIFILFHITAKENLMMR